ncbi:MAG: hypothetical protein M3063_00440 [Actinomycetota bacterium]|nr:hypothetical protein [Actinomycetota bacterium]
MQAPIMHGNSSVGAHTRRPGIELVPDPDGERLIAIDAESGRQVRMSAFAGRLLGMLDGRRSSAELAGELGLQDPSLVDQAITRFEQLALVEEHRPLGSDSVGKVASELGGKRDNWFRLAQRAFATRRGDKAPPPTGRRWRYRRPATLEVRLVDPRRLLQRLRPLSDAVATRTGQAALWTLTVAGVLGTVSTAGQLGGDLSRPAPWWVAIGGLAAVLAATALHELAHGLVLTRAGGRVRRMGIMLLYGSPALFCDVSDAWRLPRRGRATVAFAGARVHGAVAAALILVAAAVPAGSAHQLLAVAAAGNAVMAVVNLYPFVKFDGYIALVGWLDRPHLRAHSMRAAQDLLLTRLVFGAREPIPSSQPGGRRQLGAGWILFGIASALSAPVLVALAFRSYEPLLLTALGPVGAVLTVCLLVLAVAQPTAGLVRAANHAAAAGAPPWRRIAGAAVLSFVVGALLAVPKVQLSVPSVYQRLGSGVVLVVPDGATVRPDTEVTLQRAGVVLHPVISKGEVCGKSRTELVDSSAGSPVVRPVGAPVRTVHRRVVPLCAATGGTDLAPRDGMGLASVSGGSVPIGTWLKRTFVQPAITRLR